MQGYLHPDPGPIYPPRVYEEKLEELAKENSVLRDAFAEVCLGCPGVGVWGCSGYEVIGHETIWILIGCPP